jgi:hypothetical protein
MLSAIGLELSTDSDVAAIAVASPHADGRWAAGLRFYGSPDEVVAECSRLYLEVPDCCGVFCDPMPCAGILDDLRAEVWLNPLGPEDVAAASWQFTTDLRVHRLKLEDHPALRESMRVAVPRETAARFAFERRKVAADMTSLNACAFALLGLRRNVSDPSVIVL